MSEGLTVMLYCYGHNLSAVTPESSKVHTFSLLLSSTSRYHVFPAFSLLSGWFSSTLCGGFRCVGQRCWVYNFRWKRTERKGSRARGSSWKRELIWVMDLNDSLRALFHPLFLLSLFLPLLLLPFLALLRAPPVPQNSPASPGWEEAWSRVSPFSVWLLALPPSHWCSWDQ